MITQLSNPADIDREFWADKSMSYRQLKDVHTFKKFADAKMNK
jgi:hypothetical protein